PERKRRKRKPSRKPRTRKQSKEKPTHQKRASSRTQRKPRHRRIALTRWGRSRQALGWTCNRVRRVQLRLQKLDRRARGGVCNRKNRIRTTHLFRVAIVMKIPTAARPPAQPANSQLRVHAPAVMTKNCVAEPSPPAATRICAAPTPA
ncbi:unnamed protein product, partial [Amoebophrya sp. A120]